VTASSSECTTSARGALKNVEYDVRRDANDRGRQHEPAEFAILWRGRQLRAADGADARRARQDDGDDTGTPRAAAGDGGAAGGGGEGTGLPEPPDQREYSTSNSDLPCGASSGAAAVSFKAPS